MLCVVSISVLFPTVFEVMTSYSSHDYSECLQNIGLGQYENQNASNHDFCQYFVDFKRIFRRGQVRMPEVNVLLLLRLNGLIS